MTKTERRRSRAGGALGILLMTVACTELKPGADVRDGGAAPARDASADAGLLDAAMLDAEPSDAEAPDANAPYDAGALSNTFTTPGEFGDDLDPGETAAYSIEMDSPGYIGAQVFTGTGGCVGTRAALSLVDASGRVLVTTEVDLDNQSCARINPNYPFFTNAHVLAGTYYVTASTIGDQQTRLEISVQAGVCGDRVTLGPPESCDDGNTVGNDGCSATCTVEARPSSEPDDTADQARGFIPPWMRGALDTGDVDFYRFQLTPEYRTVAAQISVDSRNRCLIDTDLELAVIAPDGQRELAVDSTRGPDGRCGRIAPDTFFNLATTDLEAGRPYFLRVRSPSGGAVPSYLLRLSMFQNVMNAPEPNDTPEQTTAWLDFTDVQRGAAWEVPAQIDQPNDQDGVTVETNQTGMLIARTHLVFDDIFVHPCALDTTVEVFDEGGRLIASSDDVIPGFDNCGYLVLRPVPPGTYFVRASSSHGELIDRFFIYVEFQPT